MAFLESLSFSWDMCILITGFFSFPFVPRTMGELEWIQVF